MTYTIIGVIGHIDHGKSTLVRTLTGVDTDTLAEERRRGITIDLGFATYTDGEHRFAMIDAPGHQKYVGNLLAGVSAVDVGLLIVAGDQGIQEQTLEHAAIVRALGISKLVAVITRIDLTERSSISDLSQELALFLADLGFHDVPVIPISSVTGEGIAELKAWLRDFAVHQRIKREQVKRISTVVRMPIDRAFNVEGRGVVVAGTIWSGEIHVGDTLQLAGTEKNFRVREVEVHGEHVDVSTTGQRTAVNLVGVGNDAVTRGDELVSTGTHPLSRQLVIDFEAFAERSELRFPLMAQLHTATRACDAKIVGLKSLTANTSIAVVNLTEPVVATYRQACLFRNPHPVNSFAGGRVLATFAKPRFKNKSLFDLGMKLKNGSAVERLLAWIDLWGELVLETNWCSAQIGIDEADLTAVVRTIADEKMAIRLGSRFVSLDRYQRVQQFLQANLQGRTKGSDQAWVAEKSLVEQSLSIGSSELVAWSLARLIDEGHVLRLNGMVASSTIANNLTRKQRMQMDQLIAVFAGTRTPPTLKELAEQLHTSMESASSLVRFVVQQGMLLDLGHGFFIAATVFSTLRDELAEMLAGEHQVSVSAIRDRWQVTRKHAIPLLEYCDREQFTIRNGDYRAAGKKSNQV